MRMEKAGIKVDWQRGVWDSTEKDRYEAEIIFDADTVVGVGVANRTVQITRKSLESAPQLRMIAKYTNG